MPRTAPPTAIVLTGGGARSAYQVGILRWIAREVRGRPIDIWVGVSAGAINAAFMAAHPGELRQAAEDLADLWAGLHPADIFRVDARSLSSLVLRWGLRLVSGGSGLAPRVQGLVDTLPLRGLLHHQLHADPDGRVRGIARNLDEGDLKAVAMAGIEWSTGRTVTWFEGRGVSEWRRPGRESRQTALTVAHVMASSSLPLLFPAIRLGDDWYGDGGVRLVYPLAPAIHLGARRILAISTRSRPLSGRRAPDTTGYPPPAQVAGVMINAIFLDQLDQDVERVLRINRLLAAAGSEEGREELHPIDLLLLRPSVDLGRLAADYEPRLPATIRFLTRGLGTRQTKSPDVLSMLLFQSDYASRLIEIGEQDAENHRDELLALLED